MQGVDLISFAEDPPNFRPLFVGEYCFSRVSSAKIFSSDLHWNLHVEQIGAKHQKGYLACYSDEANLPRCSSHVFLLFFNMHATCGITLPRYFK